MLPRASCCVRRIGRNTVDGSTRLGQTNARGVSPVLCKGVATLHPGVHQASPGVKPGALNHAVSGGFTADTISKYEAGRPGFAPEAVQRLLSQLGVTPTSAARNGAKYVIADVGAGTGKFTKEILSYRRNVGDGIVAVEPTDMRTNIADTMPSVEVLQGVSDDLPLDTASCGTLVAAQAFHWFSTIESLREFHRVIAPGGRLGLIWNIRAPIDGHWTRSLEDFIDSCYPADVPRQQSKLWQRVFDEPEARTLFGPLHAEEWPSAPQIASLETIVQRVLSLSAVSEKPADEQAAIADEVRSLLASHPTSKGLELFELPHVVEVYWLDRLDG